MQQSGPSFAQARSSLTVLAANRDALGVKLGHRRVCDRHVEMPAFDEQGDADAMQQKLQRRIANARGVAPDAALVSPARTSVEDSRNDVHRPDALVASTSDPRDGGTAVAQKRKYRRHPKVCWYQIPITDLQPCAANRPFFWTIVGPNETLANTHPPQPDENAPERPPSAYVLFSNSKSIN